LHDLGFPSQSPFGNIPSRNPIFEDPSRIQGVRDYQAGDPLNRLNWKTTARVGELQVRRLEPAISMGTSILLNLKLAEYEGRHRLASTELAIVAAASITTHLTDKRQAVGLVTNGIDPHRETNQVVVSEAESVAPSEAFTEPDHRPVTMTASSAPGLPLRKGRGHLMNILDLLARIDLAREEDALPFQALIHDRTLSLPWGTTIVLLTSQETPGLLESLLALKRRGMVVILCLTLPNVNHQKAILRAQQVGIRALRISHRQDMDVWR
jgi:uncharacterized protein (DUF58 family)